MDMKMRVDKAILKYAVQHSIFCHRCRKVLDIRRASHYSITIMGAEEPQSICYTLCGACRRRHHAKIMAACNRQMQSGRTVRVDIYTGNCSGVSLDGFTLAPGMEVDDAS